MKVEVKRAIEKLKTSIQEVNQAKRQYEKAIATAKVNSDKLSTLLDEIIKQPHIVIDDFELDN